MAENVTLTRRAAGGGTYAGPRNLDPMEKEWGLEVMLPILAPAVSLTPTLTLALAPTLAPIPTLRVLLTLPLMTLPLGGGGVGGARFRRGGGGGGAALGGHVAGQALPQR